MRCTLLAKVLLWALLEAGAIFGRVLTAPPPDRKGSVVTIGDLVVYLADPLLYEIGRIVDVLHDGSLLVEFEDDRRTRRAFHPQEVELAGRWMAGNGQSFSEGDFHHLLAKA